MKRSRTSVIVGRRKRANGRSRYMEKVDAGKQMYGPGCCAHTVTGEAVRKAKEEARHNGTYRESYYVTRRGQEVWREDV
jgi:hypothetical protein